MSSFRFLHCADLHLDSPLRGLEADPDAPSDRIRSATRDAFVALVDYAITHRIDFILAAGDLYDGEWKDWRTGQFLVREVGRLNRAGIPFIAISGNHDAESIITRQLRLPLPAYQMQAAKAETWSLPDLDVLIHGQSFATPAVTSNLSKKYPPWEQAKFNIGLLHTNVDDLSEHANYAPSSLFELCNHGYQYWALGHVHTRKILAETPCWVIYPGNLQGRHARETGAKGAKLVTVQDGVVTHRPEFVPFDTVRWDQVKVDLASASDEDAAFAMIRRHLADALDRAEGRLLAARVLLTGATAAYAALGANIETTREKVRAEAAMLAGADIWIESVSVNITPPRRHTESQSDLAKEIQRLSPADFAPGASRYIAELLGRAGHLREKVSEDEGHTQKLLGVIEVADGVLPDSLFERARNLLLARLGDG